MSWRLAGPAGKRQLGARSDNGGNTACVHVVVVLLPCRSNHHDQGMLLRCQWQLPTPRQSFRLISCVIPRLSQSWIVHTHALLRGR